MGVLLAIVPAISAWASDTVWSKIVTDDGQHIGYTYRKSETKNGQKISVNFSQMKLREKESKTRVYANTARFFTNIKTGEIERIEREGGYKGYKTELTFTRSGNLGTITRKSRSRTSENKIELANDVSVDNGARRIKSWDFKARPVLEFKNLNLTSMNIERVEVSPAPRQSPAPHVLSLVRKTFKGDQLLTINQFDIDERSGDILTYEMDLLNRKLIYIQTDEEDAKSDIKSFSVIRSSMIASPHKIKKSALSGNIRFRFKFVDDVTFDLPQSGEQKVVRAGNFIVLDICETCGESEPLSETQRAEWLSPSAWIESDDPDIMKLAERVDDPDLTDHEKMNALGRYARKRIRDIDFMGHYSASDTMKRRRGDCGEDALLLAALGRAAGIPTRVAAGLVYSRAEYHGASNVFMPHIWTQAYIDGRWTTYDISLNGFDASHILTSVGHGDPRSISSSTQLAKRLKWEDMVSIKAPSE